MNKPVWKRTLDSWVFGDFFDGRGICRYYPGHPRADEHGWFPFDSSPNPPTYYNDQPTQNNPYSSSSSGVYVVWYQGTKLSTKLTPRQTELWNEYHNFTPYRKPSNDILIEEKIDPVPPTVPNIDLDIKIIEGCIEDELVKYSKAIIDIKRAQRIINNHDYVINRLRNELAWLENRRRVNEA